MELAVGLAAGILGGVAAAWVTARTAMVMEDRRLNQAKVQWTQELIREDTMRFVNLKREQFAQFVQGSETYWRQLEAHVKAADEYVRDDSKPVPVALPPPVEIEAAVWEFAIIAPAVQPSAHELHEELLRLHGLYHFTVGDDNRFRALNHRSLLEGKNRYEWFRSYFVQVAARDIGGLAATGHPTVALPAI